MDVNDAHFLCQRCKKFDAQIVEPSRTKLAYPVYVCYSCANLLMNGGTGLEQGPKALYHFRTRYGVWFYIMQKQDRTLTRTGKPDTNPNMLYFLPESGDGGLVSYGESGAEPYVGLGKYQGCGHYSQLEINEPRPGYIHFGGGGEGEDYLFENVAKPWKIRENSKNIKYPGDFKIAGQWFEVHFHHHGWPGIRQVNEKPKDEYTFTIHELDWNKIKSMSTIEEGMIPYFAYGADVNKSHIKKRLGRIPDSEVAVVYDYQMHFVKHSTTWGGNTASIFPSNDSAVIGILYFLKPEEFMKIKKANSGYNQIDVHVESANHSLTAKTMVMVEKPSIKYLNTIIKGMGENDIRYYRYQEYLNHFI